NIWRHYQLETPLHLVLSGRCAPVGFAEIRDYLFSDLRSGEEELLQHGHKKRVIVAMSGLLHHEQI
ncbi:hypothetical protein ACK6UW_24600, partial [Escherichia coli]